MNILLAIQARTGSSRFPGKIFEELRGKSILGHVVDAAKPLGEPIVLCPKEDTRVIKWCLENKVNVFEGHPYDLIERYHAAIEHFKADGAVRITGDCPFIQTAIIDAIKKDLERGLDYSSNTIIRSMPEATDCQGASAKAWKWLMGFQTKDREHPWKHFDQNEMVREQFVKEGMKFGMIVDDKNPIFQKGSIDTLEELTKWRTLLSQVKL